MKYYEEGQKTLEFMLQDKAQILKDKVLAYYEDETLPHEELNEKAYRMANSLIMVNQTAYALDSTLIDLCLSLFPWAKLLVNKILQT